MPDYIEVKDANGNTVKVKAKERATVFTQVSEAESVVPYNNPDVDENGVVVTAAKAQLHNWWVQNLSSVWLYLKVYDKATTPTTGDVPKLVLPVAPTTEPVQGSALTGYEFVNGIGLRGTTGIAQADANGPGTNELVVNLGHRPG